MVPSPTTVDWFWRESTEEMMLQNREVNSRTCVCCNELKPGGIWLLVLKK